MSVGLRVRGLLAARTAPLVMPILPATVQAGLHHRPPVLYPVGTDASMGPVDIAAGHINGDTVLDLVTADASMGDGASVSVLRRFRGSDA